MDHRKKICGIAALLLQSVSTADTLDFSSGQYNPSNTVYAESGFTVQASHGFHNVRLGTLAWYEGDNTITITSDGGDFDLTQLTLANTAYAGMRFESSKGGSKVIGGISGVLDFSGESWQSVSYVKIRTVTAMDVLNQIDNMVVTPVPESASSLLMSLGLVAIAVMVRKRPQGDALEA